MSGCSLRTCKNQTCVGSTKNSNNGGTTSATIVDTGYDYCSEYDSSFLAGSLEKTASGCELDLFAFEYDECGYFVLYECHEESENEPRACTCTTALDSPAILRI